MKKDKKYRDLIKSCLKGDREAQRYVYEKNAYMTMGVCLRYAKNTADAEDLVQETFIKVFTSLKQFNNDGDLGAWIRRIAVNTAIEKYRKEQRQKNHFESIGIDFIDEIAEDKLQNSLELEDLLEKIQTLPSGYRTIFNLYAIEGFQHNEIAVKLNISEGTSKSQYSRARKLLMNSIEQEEVQLNKIMSK